MLIMFTDEAMCMCEWVEPFFLACGLPRPFGPRLVVFRCSAGTRRRSALLGAQYEVDSPRIMVKACGTVLGLPICNLWRLTHSRQRLQCWGLSPNGLIIHMVFSEGGKNVFRLRPLTWATFQTGNHFSEIESRHAFYLLSVLFCVFI